MIYSVIGSSKKPPSPLDMEAITNACFRPALYGDAVFFPSAEGGLCEISQIAYDSIAMWSQLNQTDVKLEIVYVKKDDNSGEYDLSKMPIISDCVLFFIDKEMNDNPDFKSEMKQLRSEGVNIMIYVM